MTCLQDSHKAACQFKMSLESMPEKEREIKGGDAMWSWRVSSCQTAAYQYSAPRQEREREMMESRREDDLKGR